MTSSTDTENPRPTGGGSALRMVVRRASLAADDDALVARLAVALGVNYMTLAYELAGDGPGSSEMLVKLLELAPFVHAACVEASIAGAEEVRGNKSPDCFFEEVP